ncbi:MAG TPA: DNA polymerase III subunit delta' [Dissulfurispiraceae bacterium]|nr:DNA polymerase III subunit delta' [Dissulfurispiraceae bacterium]
MSLQSVIGQDKAVRILYGTLKRERVPTSILLSGDSGIGKRLAALNYAKALNCLAPVDSDACDSCISCRKIDGEIHPDVTTLLPENDEIKIEAIRRAEETLSLRPYEGRKKVLVIDDADTMNINAANAFLKTLEEPPDDSIIMLVSPSPDRLPDTIRSRCMHVRFRPLSGEAFSRVLEMKTGLKSAGPFAALAMGRPGIGITRDFANEKKWFMDIFSNMSRGEARCAWNDKNDIRLWLDLSLIMLRDMAVYSVTGKDSDLLYGERRPGIDLQQMLNAAASLQKVRSVIDLNLNKSITWNYVSGIIQKALEPVSAQVQRR